MNSIYILKPHTIVNIVIHINVKCILLECIAVYWFKYGKSFV